MGKIAKFRRICLCIVRHPCFVRHRIKVYALGRQI